MKPTFDFPPLCQSFFSKRLMAQCKASPHTSSAYVRCEGKGRKERCTPLAKPAVAVLKAWIKEQGGDESGFLFPTSGGGRLSADAVQHALAKHVAGAQRTCPSLAKKRVTPHVLRHTAAMEVLQAGVDRALIAIWLGHELLETTQIYLDARGLQPPNRRASV